MRDTMIIEMKNATRALDQLRYADGWRMIRDVRPSARQHRERIWEVDSGVTVRCVADRRFGVRYFEVVGEEAAKQHVEAQLYKTFDITGQDEVFERVRDTARPIEERLRALFLSIAYVETNHHDPAYEEMLCRLMAAGKDEATESDALALARGAVMLAERLEWSGLREPLDAIVQEAPSPVLVHMAGRALEEVAS